MAPEHDARASAMLRIVDELARDLPPQPQRAGRVTLDSSLDRDLGFDSLARVELLSRVERAFGVTLPENMLQIAETPRDLLVALGSASAATRPASQAYMRVQLQGVDGAHAEPADAMILPQVLDWHIHAHGDRAHIVVLSDVGEEEISYAGLNTGAMRIAAGLQRQGLQPRQAVAIMLPTSPEYFYTYFGILIAGGIPVPIYPPARLSQIEEHVRRHAGILANAQAVMLVTVREAIAVARLLEAHVPSVRQVLTPATLSETSGNASPVPVSPDDIALIQYTSGSTGNPKGVVLTHANLLANIRAMAQVLKVTERDVFVSWLPLYHDMGLIGAWFGSLYVGFRLVIMSPPAFLARRERWLWAIHRFRGTLSAAPNFAYELCLKRLDDAQLAHLDLSSWRLAINGAEAVNPDAITRFTERFAQYGFRADAMTPVYGLAECALGLLFPPLGRGPLIDRIRREPFMLRHEAQPAPADDPKPLRFAACGRPLPGHEVRIVDELGLEVGERVEGRLEFKGPSATSGYYRNPEETARLFHGEWLDTGDKAYMAEGEIYVTGRVKDIIIRGGRNIYPEELEEAIGALPGVRKGCVAAFGSMDRHSGTERLVILVETRETEGAARDALHKNIARAAADVLGEPPNEIVLAPPHTVLKTSSGKIRRSASRDLYEAGLVGAASRTVWWQLARLAWAGWLPVIRRWASLGRAIVYGAYVWIVFSLLAPLTWLVTVLTAQPARAWAIGHRAARLFFKLTGTPLIVRGLENLPHGTPNVLVANHAGYVDGVGLIAALPVKYAFVAKRELRDHFISRVYLERLGAQFVERFAAQQSVEDANRLVQQVARGKSLAFFPEGTFTRMSGLQPFHLGAFVAAAQAGVPVVPVAIRGSRGMLRSGQWLPRRSTLIVTVGTPILPPREVPDAYAAAVKLSEAARAQILQHCGEPDTASRAVQDAA
jgi:1-acyl-sn-glycerol-3-phosphate acyltransferase